MAPEAPTGPRHGSHCLLIVGEYASIIVKVLFVEDYQPLLKSVSKTIREVGWAADAAADGEEGLWLAENNDYDVIILDWMLTVTSLVGNNGVPRDLIYAPGIGPISERNILNLASFTDPNLTNSAPILSIQDAVLLSWPFTDSPVTLQSSSDLQNWVPVPQIPAPADGGSQLAVPRDRTRKYFRLEVP